MTLRVLCLTLATLLPGPRAGAATVDFNLRDSTGSGTLQTLLALTSKTNPQADGTNILAQQSFSIVSTNPTLSLVLHQGDWLCRVGNLSWTISVPSGTNRYAAAALSADLPTYTYTGIPPTLTDVLAASNSLVTIFGGNLTVVSNALRNAAVLNSSGKGTNATFYGSTTFKSTSGTTWFYVDSTDGAYAYDANNNIWLFGTNGTSYDVVRINELVHYLAASNAQARAYSDARLAAALNPLMPTGGIMFPEGDPTTISSVMDEPIEIVPGLIVPWVNNSGDMTNTGNLNIYGNIYGTDGNLKLGLNSGHSITFVGTPIFPAGFTSLVGPDSDTNSIGSSALRLEAADDSITLTTQGRSLKIASTGGGGGPSNGVTAGLATNISAGVVSQSNQVFRVPTKLVFLGDSITWLNVGSGYPPSYAYDLTNIFQFANLALWTNTGVSGWRLSHLTNDFQNAVVGNKPGPGTNAIAFVLIGANDYNNTASATGFTNWQTATNWANTLEAYYQGILTNGYQLCALTMTPNGDVVTNGLTDIQELQDYCNMRIKRSALPTWIVDTGSLIPDAGNTAYFYDKIHPSGLTSSNIARAVYREITSPYASRPSEMVAGAAEWKKRVGIGGYSPKDVYVPGNLGIGTNNPKHSIIEVRAERTNEVLRFVSLSNGIPGYATWAISLGGENNPGLYLGAASDTGYSIWGLTYAWKLDWNGGDTVAANTVRTPYWAAGTRGKPVFRSQSYWSDCTGDLFQGCNSDNSTNSWLSYDGTWHAKAFVGDGSGLTNLSVTGGGASNAIANANGNGTNVTLWGSNTVSGVLNLSNRTDSSMAAGSRMAMYRAFSGGSQVAGVGFWMDAGTIPSFGIGYYDDASNFTLNTNLFGWKMDWNTDGLAANTFRIPYANTATTNKTVADFRLNRSDDRGDLITGSSHGSTQGDLFRVKYDGSVISAGSISAQALSTPTQNVGVLILTNPIPISSGGTGQTNSGTAGQVLMSTGSTNTVWGPQPLASNQTAQTLANSPLYTNRPVAGTGVSFGTTNADGTWPINSSATGSTPTARTSGGVMVADPVYGNAKWAYPMTSLLVQEPFLFGISRNNYQQSGSTGGTGAFKTRPATFTNAAEGAGYYRLSVTNNVGSYQYLTFGSSSERNYPLGSNFFFSCRFAAESSGTGGTNFGFNCGWANSATTPYGTWLIGFACLPSSAGGTNLVMVVRTNSVAVFSNLCTFPLTTNTFIDLSVYGSTNGPIVFATNGVPAATNAAGAAVTLTGQAVFQPQFMLHSVQTNLANGTTNVATIRFVNAYQGDQ
jgi:hypothetical protein